MTDKINEKKVIKGKIKPFKRGTALDKQVGGEHYKNKAGTQYEPINLIVDYKLDFIDGSIVKYAIRRKNFESQREKYEKIKHYCELALELKCGSP